jgi:hypothetical protein
MRILNTLMVAHQVTPDQMGDGSIPLRMFRAASELRISAEHERGKRSVDTGTMDAQSSTIMQPSERCEASPLAVKIIYLQAPTLAVNVPLLSTPSSVPQDSTTSTRKPTCAAF